MNAAWLISLALWPAAAAAQIPVLHVTPASLVFQLDGRSPAAAKQVLVRNLGSGALRWTASASPAWIRVSPASGAGAAALSVDIDGGRLPPGRHEGRITIDAPDADDSPFSITVVVEVSAAQAAPTPARAAPSASAPGKESVAPPRAGTPATAPAPGGRGASPASSGAPVPGRLRIERTTLRPATRNLPYTQAIPIEGGTPPYTVRLVEGRLPAGLVLAHGAISGTPRVQGLYPFVLAVTDASSPQVTIAHPISLRVIILQPDTALVVGPPAITLRLASRTRDGRATLAIASGRQQLEWTASADVPWLRLAPPAGLSPSNVAITVLAGQLPQGTHLGTVTVIMEGAPNSPASIPVQVTVPR